MEFRRFADHRLDPHPFLRAIPQKERDSTQAIVGSRKISRDLGPPNPSSNRALAKAKV